MIKPTKKLMIKIIDSEFAGVHQLKLNWVSTIKYYCIDSKFRTYKRLDSFFAEQLITPHIELVKLANSLRKPTPDETIINILTYVRKNFRYSYDINNYGKTEYWAPAIETFNKKTDDCDGLNGLIYVLAILAGVPNYILYAIIGNVFGGGHFYLVYFSTTHDKLVSIDSTYYPDLRSVENRAKFKLTDNKYQTIWYVFNDTGCFKHE